MAVKATFLADFTSFQQAVSQAETKLRSFESGAASVEKALGRMGDSFSGRRVLQDADLAVKAVKDLGGVTTLTAAEQSRLNVVVTEALAKYKALGQQAPPDLQNLSKELKIQTLSFKDLAVAAGAIAGIVAGASAAIGKLGERGAGVNDVREQFVTLTGAIDETSDAILGKLRTATLGTISDFELMKTANLAMSQGLDLTAEQFGTLGDTAAVLADRTGVDLKTAFDTLTQAMATGQDRTLKTIGLNIDAAKAEETYAASIGKKRSELDESEKKLAIQNAILVEGQNILAVSGKAQEDFADKVGQSGAKISNFVDKIGSWIATSPSIGAWTSTITAASSSITAMGLAYGPVAAGLTKLGPMVAGLGATFATLGTTITVTVIPALGAAFALIAPCLLPLAALAAAIGAVYLAWKYWDQIVAFFEGAWQFVVESVKKFPDLLLPMLGPIGLVVATFKHWDKISAIAKAVYEAVKNWMVDKFNAIVDKVKGLIGAVGEKFKWLKDVVVGNSYVPDMIDGIGKEFGRLGDVMTNPAQAATRIVEAAFGDMMKTVNAKLDGWIDGIAGKFGSLDGIVKGALGSLAGMLTGGFGGLIGGAIGAIGNKLAGGEEGKLVNPARDLFAGQFVTRYGGSPFEAMALAFEQAGVSGDVAERAIAQLNRADKMDAFQAAVANIQDLLGEFAVPGFNRGTRGQYLDFGRGTLAMLHGKERIVTEAEGSADASVSVQIGEAHFHISGTHQDPKAHATAIYTELIALTRRNERGVRTGMRHALGVA